MVSISEKIAAIRKEPDHIRIRYVWGCVAASMVLIVMIWLFSIAAMLKKDSPKTNTDNLEQLKSQIQNINQQAPSIKDIGQQKISNGNEGISTESNADEFQYPASNEQTEIPQSPAYSTE